MTMLNENNVVYISKQVSSLGVSAFFVENVSELQLAAMKLVTTVRTFF